MFMSEAVVHEARASTAGGSDRGPLTSSSQSTYYGSGSGGARDDFHGMSLSAPLAAAVRIGVILLFLDELAGCGLYNLYRSSFVLPDIDWAHARWVVAV